LGRRWAVLMLDHTNWTVCLATVQHVHLHFPQMLRTNELFCA